MTVDEVKALVLDVPDFPAEGIVFKDITPVVADPKAMRYVTEALAERTVDLRPDGLVAIESRGFIFGTALSQRLDIGMHLVRKRGKLPRETVAAEYQLEYGTDHVEIHADALRPGARYLIVDDVIATGGTAAATAALIERCGAVVAGSAFLIELAFLNGREALGNVPLISLIRY